MCLGHAFAHKKELFNSGELRIQHFDIPDGELVLYEHFTTAQSPMCFTKITFVSDGPYGPLQFISIYDGTESHRINHVCNTLIKSSTDAATARKLDEEEADGETASFEITTAGLKYFNLYTEDAPGTKTGSRVELGELDKNNPTQVHDYFDDPRLGST